MHKAYCSEFDNLGNISWYNVNNVGNIIICGQSKKIIIFKMISVWPQFCHDSLKCFVSFMFFVILIVLKEEILHSFVK